MAAGRSPLGSYLGTARGSAAGGGAARVNKMATSAQAYQAVTDRIVGMLESGVRPWVKPWSAGSASVGSLVKPLRSDGTPYRGVNVLSLWSSAVVHGYKSRFWLTFKGAAEKGATVRKGSKGEFAFYASTFTKESDVEGEDDKVIPFLKCYYVFNADQIDGLPAHYYAAPSAPAPVDEGRRADLDNWCSSVGVPIGHGGGQAFYMPSQDRIQMPLFGSFKTPTDYYSTLLHELTHATGHDTRCARDLSKGRFGNPAYAFEELVAELGAAYLCADHGLSPEPREDHASYIASWLKALKDDNRAIFRAAGLAEKAAAWLWSASKGEAVPAKPAAAERAVAAARQPGLFDAVAA